MVVEPVDAVIGEIGSFPSFRGLRFSRISPCPGIICEGGNQLVTP
jgi:hypothetical protein